MDRGRLSVSAVENKRTAYDKWKGELCPIALSNFMCVVGFSFAAEQKLFAHVISRKDLSSMVCMDSLFFLWPFKMQCKFLSDMNLYLIIKGARVP
jgi:hypothetical protein